MIRAKIDAGHLAAVLRAGVASNKSTLAQLAHARIEADAEGLRITTTDLRTCIATRTKAEVSEPGALLAKADLLSAACIGHGAVELIEEAGVLVVKRGARSRVRVDTLPVGQWPANDRLNWSPAGLQGAELAKAIHAVAYAAARMDIRPFCNSVCIGKGFAAASDGHRLAMFAIDYSGPNLMIPVEAAITLARALADGGDVEIGEPGNKEPSCLAAVTDLERIEVQLFKGSSVPLFDALFPAIPENGWLVADTAALKETVKRMLPFCERVITTKGAKQLLRGAWLRVENGNVWIEDAGLENSDQIGGDTAPECGGAIRAALDLSYLMKFLDAANTERVRIAQHGQQESDSRFVLLPVADGDQGRHLIAGLKL